MDLGVFEEAGESVRSLVSADLGEVRFRSHRRGLKVWLDDESAGRRHFEAQLVPRRLVDGTDGMAIEVGFHAEDGDVTRNDAAVSAIVAAEKRWRRELGPAPEAAPFLGRPEDWRRVSEVWLDPDLEDPELAFEIATRLADYVTLFTPLLTSATA